MKILILGGTKFVGRHVVEKLIKSGHDVTLLNRGKTAPGLFPQTSSIIADRESRDLDQNPHLRQNWDAVIDLSAYYPQHVSRLLQILKGRAGRYILCSTISAYKASTMEQPISSLSETSGLHECNTQEALDTSMTTYGKRKAECERVAFQQQNGGIPTVVIRPSVIYGAHDYTDRFAYWIWRASRKKKFILPDDGKTIVQLTYAPDLASAFHACLKSSEALGNSYNIAEAEPLSFRDKIQLIGRHLNTNALDHAVPVSGDWLLKQGLAPWSDLPLWIPKTNLIIDTQKAQKDLLVSNTPIETALATATDIFLNENREPKTGLTALAEAELLKKHSSPS